MSVFPIRRFDLDSISSNKCNLNSIFPVIKTTSNLENTKNRVNLLLNNLT
jgi:hypothetical protein